MHTRTLMLRNIPPRLKGRIARRVKTAGTNMNDVLVGILADHYGIDFEPSGVRRISVGVSSQALLTMPEDLKRAIKSDADLREDSMTNVAREIICTAFDVSFKPTGRWPVRA